ncbi:hypothetical protein M405DRAFT_825557 [Rhizopogon salebrosus TDB-379]|nr:hypothetical protein M405DRAFT_825557 [Rhizopogon salebrosus TDB-379]
MASNGTTVTGYHEDDTVDGEDHRTFRVISTNGLVSFYNSASNAYLTVNNEKGVVEGGANPQQFYLGNVGGGNYVIRLPDRDAVWVLNNPSDGTQISVAPDSGDDRGYWSLMRA